MGEVRGPNPFSQSGFDGARARHSARAPKLAADELGRHMALQKSFFLGTLVPKVLGLNTLARVHEVAAFEAVVGTVPHSVHVNPHVLFPLKLLPVGLEGRVVDRGTG